MRLNSFNVANYRSFFNEQTIKFNNSSVNTDAILGSNGSGKSNLFNAMAFFREFIRTSTKFEGQKMVYESFLLNQEGEKTPTTFRAEMQTEKHIYEYSFALLRGRVDDEFLQRKSLAKGAKYNTIFRRASIANNRYQENGFTNELLKNTRSDALVLTKAWENNNKIAQEIFDWLEHFGLLSGGQPIGETAKRIIEDAKFKEQVLDLLRRADLYIQDVAATETRMPDEVFNSLPIRDELKAKINRTGYEVVTTHLIYGADGKVVGVRPMSMGAHESMGTRRIFELAYPIIDTLAKGSILYIDEFETFLHPRECAFIVSLFDESVNEKNAQLIVNTHNTQIIDQVGRNNIHLLGKNNREETILGAIPKDVRTDDPALEKKYNKGMFGAVPNIEQAK
jgi:AAA15 family ATPase/GTPase